MELTRSSLYQALSPKNFRKAKEGRRVRHKIFGAGKVTHFTSGGLLRITFDSKTGGKRVHECWVHEIAPADDTNNGLAGWEAVAQNLFKQVRQLPDATASERAAKEFFIGIIAGHKGLQAKAYRSLETIAKKATRNLYDSSETTARQSYKYGPIVQDGGPPHTMAIVNELLTKALSGESKIDFRYWGRVVRQKKIDAGRKAASARRKMHHNTAQVPAYPLEYAEEKALWVDPVPLERKERSDKGRKRGRNRKVRKDKGIPKR